MGQAQQILMYCGENIKIDYIGKQVLQVATHTVGILQCNPIQSAISRNLIGQIFGTE